MKTPTTTDHFTDADGTHFVDGHPAPCCGHYDAKPGERGRWVPLSAVVIERDENGEWPEWAYEAGSQRLANVGGTDQWKHKSYRMAYLRVVLDSIEVAALAAGEADHE